MTPRSYREYVEIRETLRGLAGKWLFEYLRDESAEVQALVMHMLPENLRDTNDREQLIGKANALAELVERIPSKLDEEIKRTQLDK